MKLGTNSLCAVAVAGLGLAGCQGVLENGAPFRPSEPDGSWTGTRLPGRPPLDCTTPSTVGAPVPVRRLTRPELEATIADVLNVSISVPLADETLLGYRANTSSVLDTASARTWMQAVEPVAAALAAELAADDRCAADCAAFVIDAFAESLFRRPLDASMRARFVALYDAGLAAEGAEGAVRFLLEGLLNSPRLLYLLEATRADGSLDGYSTAARLSYALWGGPPDRALLELASSGALDTVDGVALAADRMIDDPRFERGISEFVVQWLGVELLDEASSRADVVALPEETQRALRREPVRYVVSHIRRGSTVAELLLATETPFEPALSDIYGRDVLSVDGEVAHLDPSRRAGLLTLPGVLAALSHAGATSPTRRGQRVLANLLCRPPRPPPPGVPTTLPPPMPGATTRERLEAHFSDESCASCHASMDGIGFTFERFDWLGRSREMDNGLPIDDRADVDLGGGAVTVEGATDLAGALSERPEVARCLATHFSRFAVSVFETDDFLCTVEELAAIAEGPEGLRGMVIAYVTSPWFLAPSSALQGDAP